MGYIREPSSLTGERAYPMKKRAPIGTTNQWGLAVLGGCLACILVEQVLSTQSAISL